MTYNLSFKKIVEEFYATSIDDSTLVTKHSAGESVGQFLDRVKPELRSKLADEKAPKATGDIGALVTGFGAGTTTGNEASVDHKKLLTSVLENHGFPFVVGFNSNGSVKTVSNSATFSKKLTEVDKFDTKLVIQNLAKESCIEFKPDTFGRAEAFETETESEIYRSNARSFMFSARGSSSFGKPEVSATIGGSVDSAHEAKEDEHSRSVSFSAVRFVGKAKVTLNLDQVTLTKAQLEEYDDILRRCGDKAPKDDLERQRQRNEFLSRLEEAGLLVPLEYSLGGVLTQGFSNAETGSLSALADYYNSAFNSQFMIDGGTSSGGGSAGGGAASSATTKISEMLAKSVSTSRVIGGDGTKQSTPLEWQLSLDDYTRVVVIDSDRPRPIWQFLDSDRKEKLFGIMTASEIRNHYLEARDRCYKFQQAASAIRDGALELAAFTMGTSKRNLIDPALWTRSFGYAADLLPGIAIRDSDKATHDVNALSIVESLTLIGGPVSGIFLWNTVPPKMFAAPDGYVVGRLSVSTSYSPCGGWRVKDGGLGEEYIELSFYQDEMHNMSWSINVEYVKKTDLFPDGRLAMYEALARCC